MCFSCLLRDKRYKAMIYTGCFVTCGTHFGNCDCMPKNNEKKSYKYVSYMSSFMKCNEFYKQNKLSVRTAIVRKQKFAVIISVHKYKDLLKLIFNLG